MSAHSDSYPWPSYYGHFDFFETRMRQHVRVAKLSKSSECTYDMELSDGGKLRVFICECYSFGVAEYIETTNKLGKVGLIVINSAWCGYTNDAKKTCRDDKVGLFKIGDLMAALHKPKMWEYLNEFEAETFKKNGWL